MRTADLTPRASGHLDMLRGVAALAVVAGHVRGMFFIDLQALGGGAGRPFLSVVYGLTSLGHEAVMVFFVLSGFLVGGSVIGALEHWSWKPYVVNRLTRLYLVLVPALLLTAAADQIAWRLPAGSIYFEHAIEHFNSRPFAESMGIGAFLGNLVFLQTIAVGMFGSNSPLWSLANEFWYYALFPLIGVALAGRVRPGQRVVCTVLFLGLCIWLPIGLVLAFAIWLFGVAIHWLPAIDADRRPILARSLAVGAGLCLALVLASLKLQRLRTDNSDMIVGLAAAAVVFAVVRIRWRPAPLPKPYVWLASRLSRCSYSLYAIHFPLVVLTRVSMGTRKWPPTLLNLAVGLAFAVALLLIGNLFASVTEARTNVVRRWVMQRVSPRAAAPAVVAG